MRIAEICPTCATYINASCILYDGEYLSNLDIAPLDSLEDILEKIDELIAITSGSGIPTLVPEFVGQYYIDNATQNLYIGLSDTIPNWGLVGAVVTTTTTTTVAPTTTTTTTL